MTAVTIFRREPTNGARDFGRELAARGHHVVYRAGESNRCPGCGRAQWYVGRVSAECGFCGTAVALADAEWSGGGVAAPPTKKPPAICDREAAETSNRRRHDRIAAAAGRTLQMLIDGSPHAFAVHNVSAGGLMASDPVGLAPGAIVQVRFEGGILVPAQVRWTEGALTGLAFTAPVAIDLSPGG